MNIIPGPKYFKVRKDINADRAPVIFIQSNQKEDVGQLPPTSSLEAESWSLPTHEKNENTLR